MLRLCPFIVPLLAVVGGCQYVRVQVDCRLASDQSLHGHLKGPRYVIRGADQDTQASLAFEEFSALFERMLDMEHPRLKRVPVNQEADLVFTLAYRVLDRGAGVETYPVYGHSGYWGHWRPGFHHYDYYGTVGTHVETVHLGYVHVLFVAAWIKDDSQPAEKRVIWEGSCDLIDSQRSMKPTMPFLMAALEPYYGRATSVPVRVKFDPDDERVFRLAYGRGSKGDLDD